MLEFLSLELYIPLHWSTCFSSAFLLVCKFTLQCIFCSFRRNARPHILFGDRFYFYLFIFQCDVFPCLLIVLAWEGFPLRTGVVGPFLMTALFCHWFVVNMLDGSCTGAMLHLSSGVCAVCCYCHRLCWKIGNGLLDNDFMCSTSDSLKMLISD